MRKILLHFLFWIFFFAIWNRIMYFYISSDLNRIYFSALDVSMIILAFYTIYLYLMPYYFKRKNIWVFTFWSVTLIVVLSGIFSWMMWIFLQHNLVPIHFEFSWHYKDLQLNRLFIVLVGVLGGCFVKLALDRLQAAERINVMEKEKSVAELNYLKAQINPHFLFNSLNGLYTQLEIGVEMPKPLWHRLQTYCATSFMNVPPILLMSVKRSPISEITLSCKVCEKTIVKQK
jgi:two-component system LytT family sensor kinase